MKVNRGCGRSGRAHGEVGHVSQEDEHLDYFSEGRARLGEDSTEVRDAQGRLLADGAHLEEGAVWTEGDLAGAVDGCRGLDSLRLEV